MQIKFYILYPRKLLSLLLNTFSGKANKVYYIELILPDHKKLMVNRLLLKDFFG